MRKKAIFISLIFALCLAITALTIWNKPHRDVSNEQAISITAATLFTEYSADEHAADGRFLNKALEVSGKVAETDTNQDGQIVLVLDAGGPEGAVSCTMRERNIAVRTQDQVTVKGICTGMVMDVVLTDCVLVK